MRVENKTLENIENTGVKHWIIAEIQQNANITGKKKKHYFHQAHLLTREMEDVNGAMSSTRGNLT